MPDSENWDSLIDPGNQGATPAAVQPPATPASPANPSEAVAADPPAPSPEAKATTDLSAAPVAEAKPASADTAPAKVEPPATTASGEATVDPSKALAASDDEETDAEKAEIAALPEAAQPAARRNRKEARQFRSFKTAIGGEGFVEDASLIVPAFHTKPAAEFDAILQERSPLKATELFNHMVYTAIDGAQSRPILINELVAKYRPELEAALGVSGTEQRQPESRVEPSATASADSAANAASLATINELLADPYASAEQKQALELAKSAITEKTATDTKLANIEEQLRILTDKDKTSQTQTVAEQTQALGGEFIGEVMQFAGTRLNELGLSAADGDPPELVRYIESERKKILDLLPGRFQTHENASKLISQLEEKFERIPTLANAQAKAAEKRAAWKFLPPVKVCVDDILGQEVASCLYAIETARGARQAPLNQDQRKELVGHEAPGGGLTPATTIVKGKGVDALWDSLTSPQPAASIPA